MSVCVCECVCWGGKAGGWMNERMNFVSSCKWKSACARARTRTHTRARAHAHTHARRSEFFSMSYHMTRQVTHSSLFASIDFSGVDCNTGLRLFEEENKHVLFWTVMPPGYIICYTLILHSHSSLRVLSYFYWCADNYDRIFHSSVREGFLCEHLASFNFCMFAVVLLSTPVLVY